MHIGHAQERIVAPGAAERAAATEVFLQEVRGLTIGLQPDQNSLAHDRPLHRLHTIIVEADSAQTLAGLVGSNVEVFGTVLELTDIRKLDEAGAGVVRLVTNYAVQLGGVRHDLVDGEHGMGWRKDQIANACSAKRLGGAQFDRIGRDLFGFRKEVGFFGDFPAAHGRYARVIPSARHLAHACSHAHRRRGGEKLLFDVGAFTRCEVAPFVAVVGRYIHRGHALDFTRLVDDRLRPVLFVGLRHRCGMLLHRRDVVLDVLRHGRQFYIRAFGDRTCAGNFDGHAGDAANFVLGYDRTAGKTPHAAVDDTYAKACCLTIGVARNAAATAPTSAATTTSTTTTASATTTSTSTPTSALAAAAAGGCEVGGSTRQVGGHGEAHIGVGAPGHSGFTEYDVGHALEFRLQDAALRSLCDQLGDDVMRNDVVGRNSERASANAFDEIAT